MSQAGVRTEAAHKLGFEVNDVGMSMRRRGHHERVLEAVLDLVPQSDEELDVDPDGVVLFEVLLEALPQFPRPALAVLATDVATLLPVVDVDLPLVEVGVEQVLPCEVHVDHEVEEAPLVARPVIEIDGEARLAPTLLQRVPPAGSRRHHGVLTQLVRENASMTVV